MIQTYQNTVSVDDPMENFSTPHRDPRYEPGGSKYVAPAIRTGMTAVAEFLGTDVGAAWAVANEISGGNVAIRAGIMAFGPIGLSAVAVGAAAYTGTTAIDKYFNGALHEAFGDAVGGTIDGISKGVRVLTDLFGPDRTYSAPTPEVGGYFGDTFDAGEKAAIETMCRTWDEYWPSASDDTNSTPAEPIVNAAVHEPVTVPTELVGVSPRIDEHHYVA